MKKLAWNSTLKNKIKIITSTPITSWQIEGTKVEAVTDFLLFGWKITVHGDYAHKIKSCLFLGRQAMSNLGSVLKSRDTTLPTKICLCQSYGFSSCRVWIWELDHKEGWVPKNWCFQLWCCRRLLRVLGTAKRSDQSILKATLNTHWMDWFWSSNTLATSCEELPHWKRPWCWDILKARVERGGKGWDGWILVPSLTQWTFIWANFRR